MSTKNDNAPIEGADDTDTEINSVASERSNRLREAVKAAGGNKSLAEKSGIPLSTLNGYLAGADPKSAAIVAISDASGLSLEWLASGRGPRILGKLPTVVSASPPFSPPLLIGSASPFRMFATVDVDQLAAAMLEADRAFTARGGAPTARERAQAVALIYDMLSAQSEGLEQRDAELGKR